MNKTDLLQIKQVVKEEITLAIEKNNEKLLGNLITKEVFIANNKNLVTKDDLIQNNKNLVTKDDLQAAVEELALATKKGFDMMEERFQDLEYQISLRPTMQKIMDWSDKRIHSLELSMQNAKYIL